MKPLHVLIWSAGIPTSPKIVLLCLELFADKDLQCWPSHKTIAQNTGLSVATVKRALLFLEDQNLITKQRRESRRGADTSCIYTLNRQLIMSYPLVHSDTPPAHGELPMNSPIELPIEGTTKSLYFVERASADADTSKEQDPMRYAEDEGPDVTNPFSSVPKHPAGKGRGPRNGRDISTWNNMDVAQEFADQAGRFFPMVSNRCNLAALAKNLKLDRERTGATPEMHVAMIDAFFWDKDRIREGTPLWMQFSGSLARLQDRAAKTLTWDRDVRWGRSDKDPEGTTRVLTPLESQNQWLIAHGMEPLSETESDDD